MACSRFLEMEIAISDERFQKRMEGLRPMLIIPHPSFKQDSAEHDIVLIKLTRPLKLNDQVKLAALPSPTTNRMDDCAVLAGAGHGRILVSDPQDGLLVLLDCPLCEGCRIIELLEIKRAVRLLRTYTS